MFQKSHHPKSVLNSPIEVQSLPTLRMMGKRGNEVERKTKLFPICTDKELQVKGNPLIKDLATCSLSFESLSS